MSNDVSKQASELFNSMSQEDRHKAGLGYSLAQLTTIKQTREINKNAQKALDKRYSDWQKNIEKHISKEYLTPSTNKKKGE